MAKQEAEFNAFKEEYNVLKAEYDSLYVKEDDGSITPEE
jgi:hypothetical protein